MSDCLPIRDRSRTMENVNFVSLEYRYRAKRGDCPPGRECKTRKDQSDWCNPCGRPCVERHLVGDLKKATADEAAVFAGGWDITPSIVCDHLLFVSSIYPLWFPAR